MNSATWRRLIAQHDLEVDASLLNLSFAMVVEGPFDKYSFAWALERMIENYPALGPVHPASSRLPEDLDAENLLETEQGRLLGALLARERTEPFDLACPPLVRAVIVRLRPTQNVLILTWHHAVADAWALGLFVDFLCRAYSAARSGSPLTSPLPPSSPPTFERNIARWRAAERKVLKDSLAGLTARERDPFPSEESGPLLRWTVSFSAEYFDELKSAAITRRVTPFVLLCSAVAQAVCCRYDLPSVLLGTTVLNRHSTADFNAGHACYQGALFRVRREAPIIECATAVAAAAERTMDYEEQVACTAEALGARCPQQEPALFVLFDRHPLAGLHLAELETAVLGTEDDIAAGPRPVHSPHCGRLAVFFREATSGATLNIFARRALTEHAERLSVDIRRRLAAFSVGGERPAPEAAPWRSGFVKMYAPVVNALSPVTVPVRHKPA